jgi:DNA polymerase-3 subunit beta
VERGGESIGGIDKGIIIPKKGILEIRKILEDRSEEEGLEIYFDQNHGFFRVGTSMLVIRLIDGEFPEYEQVIPKENDKKLVLEKERMVGSLKRVSTMASERVEGIKFSVSKNSVELSSYHQDFGDAKEEVDVTYEGSPIQIGFNARYLIEALNVIDTAEVMMELKDEGSPGMIKPITVVDPLNQLCIIMPMRI